MAEASGACHGAWVLPEPASLSFLWSHPGLMGFQILSLGRSNKDARKISGVMSLRYKASPSRDTGTSPQILRSCRKPGAVGTCDISAALGSGGTSGILAVSQSCLHQDGCVSKYALGTLAEVLGKEYFSM